MVFPIVSLNRELKNWMNKETKLLSPCSGCCHVKTGMSHDGGSLGRLWLSAVPWHQRGFCPCCQFSAITEGCCKVAQSSFFTQKVKSSHLERNLVYHALIMCIIEYSSDTKHLIYCVKPSPARPTIFLSIFTQANHLFLAKTLSEV